MVAEELNTASLEKIKPLRRVYEVRYLKNWIYRRTSEYLTGNILEIDGEEDIFNGVCKMHDIPAITTTVDRMTASITPNNIAFQCSYDTVLFSNIQNMTKDNPEATSNYFNVLAPGGHLIICLPVHTALYKGLSIGMRRWDYYNKQQINELLNHYFKLLKIRYFNIIGCEKDDTTSFQPEAERYYNLVPFFQSVKNSTLQQRGLFMLVVAKLI